jgi:hypothetical protein
LFDRLARRTFVDLCVEVATTLRFPAGRKFREMLVLVLFSAVLWDCTVALVLQQICRILVG